jgi:hypothetical protein
MQLSKRNRGSRSRAVAFTLAEVLAAHALNANLITVAIEALHVSTHSCEVAVRKKEAARVAERLLNESIVSTSWSQSTQSGKVTEGFRDFDWTLRNEPWSENPMRLITVEVKYGVRGKDYSVQLSTLADGSASFSQSSITP